MKSGFRVDIAILRLLAIVIVVAFHAYGMCYAESHLPSPLPQIYATKYEWFNQCIPINVAMPLFIFISGYLFGLQLLKGKYLSLWEVAKDKFKRLMVPYYFFLPIMMATYSGFSIEPYFTGEYWHMWFLPALWCTIIVAYLLQLLIFSKKKLIEALFFGGLFALNLLEVPLPPLLGFHHILDMSFYFLLGMWFCRNEEIIESIISKYLLLYPFIVVYLVTIIWFPTEYGDKTLASIIGSTLAIIILWYVFKHIVWDEFSFIPFLLKLSACSFGIYIFHNWIGVYLVSSTAKKIFPIIVDFAEQHIILFPLFFTIVAFVLSASLTKLLLKTELGRKLIG